MQKLKRTASLLGIIGILLVLTGVTYTFFNYTRTGSGKTLTIDKSCSVIKNMSGYAWIGDNYKAGTTVYGSNNEVCDSW